MCSLGTFQNGECASNKTPYSGGDLMVKLDLKDVYFAIPIHQEHQKWLRF